MAASFGPDTRMLSYGPRSHANPGGRNNRVWLGWPAWAFRVVAPEFSSNRLNALQRAALGVLRASKLTALELGHRLGIHRELAAFVVAESQEQQLVDSDWTVTKAGVQLLEDELAESAKLVPGWVFRDGLSGRLLPFVAPALEYARTVRGKGCSPLLNLGSTGSPWQQKVWMLDPPKRTQPEMPEPAQILRAVRESQRCGQRWQRFQQSLETRAEPAPSGAVEGIDVYEDEVDDPDIPSVDLDRLSSIEPEPQPVYLVTYLYTPRGDDKDGDWHACEFFGRGYDPTLRRWVMDVARRDPALSRLLDQRLFAATPHGNLAAFQQTAMDRRSRARILLQRALTIEIVKHAVADEMQQVLDAYLEWREVGDRAGPRHARNVLMECRRAMERLFKGVAKESLHHGVWQKLSSESKEINRAVLRAAAKQIGLSSLPDAMCRVSRGQVRAVSDYDNSWRLRPLVVATLLRARDDATHPLALAAKRDPDVLERVEHVAKHGGKAAHTSGSSTPEVIEIDEVVQGTLDVAALLLDLPTRPLKEVMADG